MCALVRESSSWCCNNNRDSGDDLGHPQTQVTEVSLVYNGAVSTQGLRVCHGRRKLGSHTPAHKCFHPRSDPHHFCSSFISEIKPMATFNFQGIKVFLLRARARGGQKVLVNTSNVDMQDLLVLTTQYAHLLGRLSKLD